MKGINLKTKTNSLYLRLFKMARNKMRSPNLEGEARAADLESIFFKLEVEMEGTVCRDSVCIDNVTSQLKYLQVGID